MRCNPFQPRTKICQAAHYAEHLVEEAFHLELTAGLRTQGTHKKALSGRSSSFRTQEETITESILVRLSAMFGDVVQAETFTRPAETASGADWFWILDFGHKLVPMLVQAKRIVEPWDGDPDWSVAVSLKQKKRLESTANAWNVDAHFCLYAPIIPTWRCVSWLDAYVSDFEDVYRLCGGGFMHLIPTSKVTVKSFKSDDLPIVQHMTPFTCLCCCATDPNVAEEGLNPSPEKFKEPGELESLIARAREDESIKGSAIFKMGGERRD